MERIDLGDNSAKFIIQPSDTLSTIHALLTAFMAFRGWTLISTVGAVADAEFTAIYSSATLSGGTKRIKLLYAVVGVNINLGLAVSNEVGNTVGLGFTDIRGHDHATVVSHVIKSAATNEMYCFASPRWCYITAKGSSLIKTVNLMPPQSYVTSYEHYYRWDGSYGYSSLRYPKPFVWDSNSVSVNGHTVSKNITQYNGTDTVYPSVYAHRSQRYALYDSRIYGTVSENANMSFSKLGVTGCCELLDCDSSSPYVYVDTCGLMQRPSVHTDIEYAIFDALNMNKRGHGISTVLDPVRGKGTVCLTAGDPREFSDLNLGKDALKFNGKNFLQNIQISNPAVGYNGYLLGILATQADIPGNFLSEVFLRVDESYNLSDSGEVRKFFVIPGYASMNLTMNRRRWRKEALNTSSQTCVRWVGTVYEGTPTSGYARDSFDVESNGRWSDYQGAVQIKQNDSFLVPA